MSCKISSVNSTARSTCFYTAICLWNSLPSEIKQINNRNSFKKHAKFFIWMRLSTKRNHSTVPLPPCVAATVDQVVIC